MTYPRSFLRRLALTGLALASLIPVATLRAVVDAPVSPGALPEVSQLMTFLDGISGQKILAGQYETVDWFGVNQETEMDHLKALTGDLPAVRGMDFMFLSESDNVYGIQGQRVAERAIHWHQKGGIVALCFHCKVTATAAGTVDFYTSKTTFDPTKAVIDGTPENVEFVAKFDMVAEQLKKLQAARVPVIWRPFHECSGGWFWWGSKGSTAFKALWRYLYNRYTNYHHLTNLIWCYNPTGNGAADTDLNLRNWYPGDDVVDMISLDFYPNAGTHPDYAAEFKKIAAYKGGHKLISMSENGGIPDPDTMFTNGANWNWFATWSGDFIMKETNNSNAFVQKVYSHSKVITLSELPALYATKPVFTAQPKGGDALVGDHVTLSAYVLGGGALTYQWNKDGAPLSGANAPTLALPSLSLSDAGTYTLTVSNIGGTVTSAEAILNVSAAAGATSATRLINLSTRAKVGANDNVLIAGFSIAGAGSKKVLIRGVGPTIGASPYNVAGTLADPYLALYNEAGVQVLANNDWELDDKSGIVAATTALTIWGLTPRINVWDTPYDAALVATLPAGNYTAILTGAFGTSGVALVEVYDLDKTSAARLRNLSSRGRVGTSADQMIAGFVTEGSGTKNFLIRAVGPSLEAFKVPGLLADPTMDLVETVSRLLVATNNDWATLDTATIANTSALSGAFPLVAGAKDAVLLQSVSAGNYTANVTGVGATSGVALLEVYEAP